ncbi:hypothetical protein EVA_08242 [gut metagenome]|uniref:Uncharacterized protein n=1 Tax=gut metagenome TaxID=749906 RepID=J9G8U6_9ZZZZ
MSPISHAFGAFGTRLGHEMPLRTRPVFGFRGAEGRVSHTPEQGDGHGFRHRVRYARVASAQKATPSCE